MCLNFIRIEAGLYLSIHDLNYILSIFLKIFELFFKFEYLYLRILHIQLNYLKKNDLIELLKFFILFLFVIFLGNIYFNIIFKLNH
jgi:hypothetical protein